MNGGDFEERIKDEVEFARALVAVLLAVRLKEAEDRAEQAYDRIVQGGAIRSDRRSA